MLWRKYKLLSAQWCQMKSEFYSLHTKQFPYFSFLAPAMTSGGRPQFSTAAHIWLALFPNCMTFIAFLWKAILFSFLRKTLTYSFGWDLHCCNRCRDLDREKKQVSVSLTSSSSFYVINGQANQMTVGGDLRKKEAAKSPPWRPPPPPELAPLFVGRLWAEQ